MENEEMVDSTTTESETEVLEDTSEDESSQADPRLEEEAKARRELTARAKRAEAEKRALEAKLATYEKSGPKLDVDDYLDISTSLEGLDPREKEFLASQHKLTGKPLKELRQSEDFSIWQSGYKAKVEKEKTLKPSSTQNLGDKPRTLVDELNSGDMAKKEELLKKYGLYQDPRPNSNSRRIGN